jgi:hypothetical protein
VSDRRYSTAAWQRTRKAILRRDGHTCQIQGPRCRGIATTVHHRIPSSQRPDLFYDSENLVAACTTCNYGGGNRVRVDNGRRRLEQLEQIILAQDQRIQELLAQLAEHEAEHPDPGLRRARPKPAIY